MFSGLPKFSQKFAVVASSSALLASLWGCAQRDATTEPVTEPTNGSALVKPSSTKSFGHRTPPLQFPTAKIEAKELSLPLHLKATIEPDFGKEVDVSSRIAGRVKKVMVKPGQFVAAKETTVIIDSKDVSELQAELVEAESKLKMSKAHQQREGMIYEEQMQRPKALLDAEAEDKEAKVKRDLAESDFKRVQELFREKITSEKDYNAGKAALAHAQAVYEQAAGDLAREQSLYKNVPLMQHDVQLAKAEVDRAKQHLDTIVQRLEFLGMTPEMVHQTLLTGRLTGEVRIAAPVAGVVSRQEVEAGEHVQPDKPILTITDLSTVIVRADLPETHLSRVKLGSKVIIRVPSYRSQQFLGAINFISDQVNPQTHTVAIRAQLDNADRKLKKDMSAEIDLEAQPARLLICPKKAISERREQAQVFVKTADGGFEERNVTIGGETKDAVEIVSGLEEGDEVAIDGLKQIRAELAHHT
jgi:RND family efflux transporter MFP subunit